NTSINQSLDNRQKQFLALLGDSIQRAFYPAVTIDSFSADKILYEKVFNGSDSFYRYSTDPQKARYSLSFVDVGQGNGNYVPDFNGANGKVYRYVPPVNGMKMGRFEPVQILVAPRLQQLITAAMEHKPEEGMSIRAELASGKLDVNRFSKLNDGDDRGWAAKITFQNEDWLKQNQALQLKTHLDYEWVQQQFRPLERLRPVEFYRDWGLPLLPFPIFVNENLLSASATLSAQQQHSAGYRLTHYRRSDDYNGFQHSAFHHLQWKGWNLNNRFSLTSYRYGDKTGAFWRPVLDLYKELKKLQHWRFGMNYMLEKNKIQTRSNGMIQPDAFWFDVFSAYLQSDPSRPNRYKTIF
ncbi:MAG: hypothetical protein RMK43_13055, partial [Cyclobacteriaceae bacterium]|nr:hypothetical protein [Cyclobacteriaceae bacterium]